ncbi:MAG TPA: DsbC family protein [Oleiagrimonas sp.]|nr:DsbC family protein [Oleiagrimonas sp.]
MRRILLLCVLAGMTFTAMAADTGPAAVKAALERMAPGATVTHLEKAPMPGFYQALVGGRMVYVSADGTWIMDGQLYNARQRSNLTEDSMRVVRRKALAGVPDSKRIIFAPPHPKYTITVFTDLDCAYCRAFHHHIKQFNADGIAVEYLFWPRSGIKGFPSGKPTPSYLKAVSVWCSADRKAAFTAAKNGKSIPSKQCKNPVADEFRLGESIGVNGTPTIIAADGSVIGGYVTPPQLLHILETKQAGRAAAKSGG